MTSDGTAMISDRQSHRHGILAPVCRWNWPWQLEYITN